MYSSMANRTLPGGHFLLVHNPQPALGGLDQACVVRHHYNAAVELAVSKVRDKTENINISEKGKAYKTTYSQVGRVCTADACKRRKNMIKMLDVWVESQARPSWCRRETGTLSIRFDAKMHWYIKFTS